MIAETLPTEEDFLLLPQPEPTVLRIPEINTLLSKAVEKKASDVAIGSGEEVWVRVHGVWWKSTRRLLVPTEVEDLLNAFARTPSASAQITSGHDLDFRYEIALDRFRRLRFRVNATACQGVLGRGMEVTMRSIPGEPPSLADLHVEEAILKSIYPLFGLILVTGPVGSGKTTLLAAVLAESARTSRRRILTYESPVEFDLRSLTGRIAPVTQMEIPVDLVGGWAAAPRNSLRRAADIVLFGEARDRETMERMLENSETGVATYSTAHTNGVVDTLSRIVDVFPWEERDGMLRKMIANLRLIVNQRLFPKIGGGRVALREFLEFTPRLRKEMLSLPYEKIIPFLMDRLDSMGQSLVTDARRKYVEGLISEETLDQIIQSTDAEAGIALKKAEGG